MSKQKNLLILGSNGFLGKNVLKLVEEQNEYNLPIKLSNFKGVNNLVEPNTISFFKKFLVDKLSYFVHEYDQINGLHHVWFEEQSTKLTEYKKYTDEKWNLDYFSFNTIVSRIFKNKVFNISVEGVYDVLNDKSYIIKLKLVGFTTDDYSKSGFLNYYKNNFFNFDKKGVHCSLSTRRECKQNYTNKNRDEYDKNKEKLEWEDSHSKCFFKEANSKTDCLSKDIKGATGVWDTQCRFDTDCPFFGSNGNLNYTNKRGGCMKDGYCELPLGMVRIGYKLFRKDKKYKPLCHNCKVTKECLGEDCSRCCDSQKNKDYAFENDMIQRDTPENRKKLNELGLKVFDLKLR